MSARITASGLSLHTPDHRVLVTDLNLVVASEVTGLVGQNGSGKSTLLAALAAQHPVSKGAVRCEARVEFLQQISAERPGRVADALGIGPALACLDRISSGEALAGDLEVADWSLESRAEAALARMGVAQISLRQPLYTLSGGQRARVLLASAWLKSPDILLLDEPTNNLDAEGQAGVHALIEQWPGGLVVASHDRTLLEKVDRILALAL